MVDASSRNDSDDVEARIKARTVDGPATDKVTPLSVERQLLSNGQGSTVFVYPVSITAPDDGNIYISDNNAHAVRVWNLDSNSVTTLPTQTPNGLMWPNAIHSWKDSLYVADDQGIKVLGRNGSFQRLVTSYYGISDFAVSSAGTIYVNPRFRKYKEENPLIVELSADGTRIRGFGDRLNHSQFGGLDDEAYLCTTDDYVIAVFKYLPVVHIYDRKGKLIRQFRVEHAVWDSLNALTADRTFVHPKPSTFRLPRYIAGARVIENHLFVLLHLPRPEIVELTMDGKELNRYRATVSPAASRYEGFDGQVLAGVYHFWILAGDVQALALTQFSPAKG
jgi:hypothetical protein